MDLETSRLNYRAAGRQDAVSTSTEPLNAGDEAVSDFTYLATQQGGMGQPNVKSVARPRFKSVIRDARYVFDRIELFRKIGVPGVNGPRRWYLVRYHELYHRQLTNPWSRSFMFGRPMRMFKPWWERFRHMEIKGGPAWVTPAEWRDTTASLKLMYYAEALLEEGESVFFTLRLNDAVQAQAKRDPNPGDWLFRRLSAHLETMFGEDHPDFFMVLEEAPDSARTLHLHGIIAVDGTTRRKAREALKKAGGRWDLSKGPRTAALVRASPNQLRFEKWDAGAVCYLAKDLYRSSPRFRAKFASTRAVSEFGGKPLHVTRRLRKKAVAFHAWDRALVIKAAGSAHDGLRAP